MVGWVGRSLLSDFAILELPRAFWTVLERWRSLHNLSCCDLTEKARAKGRHTPFKSGAQT